LLIALQVPVVAVVSGLGPMLLAGMVYAPALAFGDLRQAGEIGCRTTGGKSSRRIAASTST